MSLSRTTSCSVVIPTYNAAVFIRETLASVFAQSRRPDEVIVVDDASPDDTPSVVEAIARTAPVPVSLIRLPTNSGGPALPLTVGFDCATGDYLAALDQDDLYRPGKLARQCELLDSHPDVEFAFGACAYLTAPAAPRHRTVFDTLGAPGTDGVVPGDRMHALLLAYGQFLIGFPGFTFRRTAWTRLRPLDQTLRIATDFDLLCRMCRLGRVAFVHEVHYLWRSHSGNLTKHKLKTAQETATILRREMLIRPGGRRTNPELARHARRRVAREMLDIAYLLRGEGELRQAAWAAAEAGRYGAVVPALTECGKVAAAWCRLLAL